MSRKNWIREELIVAYNLYCKIPFGKIYAHNPEIINLAKIIGRTPNAVALKLTNFANLDPELQKRNVAGMSHGSKSDKEIWNEFHGNWEELAFESEILLARYKGETIEKSAKIDLESLLIEGKDREAVIKARVNQNFFRTAILASYENKCCITGISIPELLVASHIIPWSKDKKNRLNPHNGLCLNLLHDKAFDRGLITITEDYKIKLSPALLDCKKNEAVQKFFLPYGDQIISKPRKFLPDKSFLIYHYENVFRI
ncbi:MAG: HNH endonuclease [Euryarchaeota archaeon]|nr:HNH endonuclease [Euryarchaeota archaeon]MCG2738481.1 HNH endonuclease [Candidatus Methanoperedenaceae archaeon]